MAKRNGACIVVMFDAEGEGACETCGVVAELRPYGERVAFRRRWICYDCMLRDPAEARQAFGEMIALTSDAAGSA